MDQKLCPPLWAPESGCIWPWCWICFSRKVVGWAIDTSLATSLVVQALRQAVESCRPGPGVRWPGLIHHSDRGCQYTSDRYRSILRGLAITVSMSRKGGCYDNAVCERFFWSFKHEWTHHRSYADLAQTRPSLFQYIELFYNRHRPHTSLGILTPNEAVAGHRFSEAIPICWRGEVEPSFKVARAYLGGDPHLPVIKIDAVFRPRLAA